MRLRPTLTALLGAIVLAQLGGAAGASTYDLTLDPILVDGSTLYGSGTLVFSGAPIPGTGQFDVKMADLTAATITIDTGPSTSVSFNLLGDISGLRFLNGELNALTAGPIIVDGDDLFVSGTTARFVDGSFQSFDTVSASVSAAPLPTTWTMLVAGLVGLGLLLRRGQKKQSAMPAAA
jgi:hypothetical protein